MSEEVKIVVKEEKQGNALDAIAQRIDQLKAKIAELNRLETAYTEKGMPEAARSTRSERVPYARELRDAQREVRTIEKAQNDERRASERSLAKDAKDRAAADKAALKEKSVAEKAITQEIKEQAAVEKAQQAAANQEEKRKNRLGRGIMAAGHAAAIGALVEAYVEDHFERQGIGNRDVARRAKDARDMELMGTFRGSSSAAFGAVESAKSDLFEREQNRPELERQAKQGWMKGALIGAGAGAATGAAAGSVVPGLGTVAGAGLGLLVGGISGGLRGKLSGARSLEEDEKEKARLKERIAAAEKVQREMFAKDGGKEIEISEKRARGELASAKAAEMALQYHREIVKVQREGGTQEDAVRSADAKFETDMRQREQALGGLINARTGAAAAARIATVGGRQFEQAREAVAAQKIEELGNKLTQHHGEAMAARTRRTFAGKPLHE